MLSLSEKIETVSKKMFAYYEDQHAFKSEERFYIYVLMDPRKPGPHSYLLRGTEVQVTFPYEPFYVGKGTSKRWHAHVKDALRGKGSDYKSKLIRKIAKEGHSVLEHKQPRLTDELSALAKECLLIVSIGRKVDGGPLVNLAVGGVTNKGSKRTLEFCKNVSERFKGKSLPEEQVRKIAANRRRTISMRTLEEKEEINLRISEGQKRVWAKKSEEEKAKVLKKRLASSLAVRRLPENKEKHDSMLRERNSVLVCCPNCGKEGQCIAMKRWHFDNCKELQYADTV